MYLFELPEKLIETLEPFRIDFEQAPEAEPETSDSGSEDEEEKVAPTNLAVTQYADDVDDESMEQWQWANRAHITGSPFVYYSSPEFVNKVLAIYKAWFDPELLITQPVECLANLPAEGQSCVLMVNSGNFAGAIISHKRHHHRAGISNPLANIIVLESKTFHRYTTRRKQGGAQSASDASRGKANSAGSTIRRANERMLQEEIQALLWSWKPQLDKCHRIFFKSPGRSNKQLLVGEHLPIKTSDPRLVQIPFATIKPTFVECKNAWYQLTQANTADPPKPPAPAPRPSLTPSTSKPVSKTTTPEPVVLSEDEEKSAKIVDLVKRSKLPALKQLLKDDPDFLLQPTVQFRAYPTTLLLAAATDKANVVTQLLQWGANPEITNANGQTIGELAKPHIKTWQALQIIREQLGETKWNWKAAKVGPPSTRDALLAKETKEKLRLRKEQEELDAKLEKEEHDQKMEKLINKHGSGRQIGGTRPSGISEDDMRQIERERRARAAEARMRR